MQKTEAEGPTTRRKAPRREAIARVPPPGIAALLLALLPASLLAAGRANIIVIMVDDMGFSDIGPYGSEIPTPHLDALAADGVRFSQFYNTGRWCP
jgi:arylsulfatase